MRYNVHEDGIRPDWKVYCDGQQVAKVFAFDTEAGWVKARCLDGHTGHEGSVHVDPATGDVCNVRFEGVVTVEGATE